MQGSLLLDNVDTTWTPPDPPSLAGCAVVALDVETTGLRWWDGDRPIGISVTYGPQQTRYLPFGHRGGGNLDAAAVRRWCQRELRDKHLVGLNIRFDLHMLRAWGIDLEAQGNTASDVAHTAALLNDSRQRFSLDALAQEFLGVEKTGKDLDATRMADYAAGMVAPRAEADARLVGQLRDRWIYDSNQQYLRGLWGIHRETGLTINPASPRDLERLFSHLNLPLAHTPDGRPSFTDAVLATHPHPVMDLVRTTRKLASLRSKYLL